MFFRRTPPPPRTEPKVWEVDLDEPKAREPSKVWPVVADLLAHRDADVPVMPDVMLQLNKLVANPDSSRDRAIQLVERDPTLTASLLRLANSARFNAGRPAANVMQALTRVGDRGLRDVLMMASAGKVFQVRGHPQLSAKLRQRAMAVAVAADHLATAMGSNRDDVFAAGLLHDVGWPIAVSLLQTNRQRFGWSPTSPPEPMLGVAEDVHAQVGQALATRWAFPTSIAAAIGNHHTPDKAGVDVQVAYTVAAAMKVIDALGVFPESQVPGLELEPVFARLRLPGVRVREVTDRTKAELSDLGVFTLA